MKHILPFRDTAKPVLIFDGDCEFCRYCAIYVRSLAHDEIEYRTYQQVQHDYPDISEAEFQAAVQLLADGKRYQGAVAAFKTLAIGGRPAWFWCYRHLPGFARIAEWGYQWVARHRRFCMKMLRWIRGKRLPVSTL